MPPSNDRPADRGLRPVQDVVGRIRFDAALNLARFSVGYEERFAGVREAPLADFIGEGEIPWHRIWFIKAGDLVVWDRRARIDLVFGSGASPSADLAAIQRACLPGPLAAPPPARRSRAGSPEFVVQPAYRFDRPRAAWVPVVATREVIVEALQVATYNVLFDLYESDKIYSERRRIACLELLDTQDADVVALQEVTPVFWAELLATPWVQERYHVSTGPDAAGLEPYGPALLSRWPLALEVHTYSEHKRLLLGRLTLSGRPLTVAAVHLTSDRKDGAGAKRAEQLAVLFDRLAREPGDALVLGDFNFGDGDENDPLTAAGLRDAWQQVHPHHPGFTFDPVANPLAALMTRSGRAVRLDRVLVRAPTGALTPVDVQMFGQRPFAEIGVGDGAEGLFVSDHFGLSALLQVAAPVAATLTAAPAATITAPGVAPGVVAPPRWAALPTPQHADAVAAVARACMAALRTDAPCLHIVGSARIGVAAPGSDLDLVCAGPASHDRQALFAAVCTRLAADGRLEVVRAAASAGLPVLRLRVGDVAVDLQYAGLPEGLPAARLGELEGPGLAALEGPDRRAALACIDPDAVMRRVGAALDVDAFIALLRRVRAWTRARQLDAGAWGLLGGYSWTLLTARAALDAVAAGVPAEPEALLRRFFAGYAAWPSGRPVALDEPPSAAASRRAPWPIYTVTPPAFNTARHLTRSTLALLQAELRRADAIVRAAAPGEPLCAPVEAAAHRRRVVLTLAAEPDAEPACRGWLEGQLLGLLLALEQQGARVRPFPRATRDDDGLQHSVGVDGGAPDGLQAVADAFTFAFSSWRDRPAGAALTAALITA